MKESAKLAEPIADWVITLHAAFEMERRQLDQAIVRSVLSAPEQRFSVGLDRAVLQSRVTLGPDSKTYLVRVVVETSRDPAEVVTVYRTSRIDKYWRSGV